MSLCRQAVTPHSGLAVTGSHKYVSLYVLLAGIIGGLLLILSLFLFCKYCRGKSQGTEGVGVTSRDSWVLREGSFSVDRPEDEVSIRGREEVPVRRGSWTSTHSRVGHVPTSASATASPRTGTEALEDSVRTSGPPTPARLVDDHVKTNIFLQRQKSFQKSDSPPITCFTKSNSEAAAAAAAAAVQCEVAVEIHPGPGGGGGGGGSSGSAEKPLLRHSSISSLGCDSHLELDRGSWDGETWRASSTDWTKLETSLDFWRQEHSVSESSYRAQQARQDSKVRYNDTGSLEEVSVDNCVDYFVEDEIMVHLEADRENLRQQYRRLWQLRATLEEDEDIKKPTLEKHDAVPASHTAPTSPDHSPEAAGSFDSNTEPLLESQSQPQVVPPHSAVLPSYETRRQHYRNILNWRLRKAEARNARRHCGRQPSLEDTSFDSVDTEESSTDASRFDQTTTSFESTTDNTDTEQQVQVHRLQLQQLRADSGYRSLEQPGPGPAPGCTSATLPLLYSSTTTQSQHESEPHRIPSLGESFEDVSEAEEGVSIDEGCGMGESEVDERLLESQRKPTGQPTCKKRREVFVEYSRDYSVDERSDALFREFSRCEVRPEDKRPGQHRLVSYRRMRPTHPHSLPYPLTPSVPIIRVAPDDQL